MAVHKEEEQKIVKQAAKKSAQNTEKTTIGDVNADLQALKDKMEGKG
jgi:small subunit ribosomal protein S1